LNPLGASNGTAKLQITESYKTNDAIALAITSGGGYQMGLLPLSINAQFIKLDANGPNFDINGQAAYQNRTQTANGLNPLATMTYSVRMVKEDVSVKAVADAFWLALQSSAWSDIAGLTYLDGAQDNSSAPQQANVQRLKNTNCSPLINYKNTSVNNSPSLPLNPIQITPATTPSAPTSSPTPTPTPTPTPNIVSLSKLETLAECISASSIIESEFILRGDYKNEQNMKKFTKYLSDRFYFYARIYTRRDPVELYRTTNELIDNAGKKYTFMDDRAQMSYAISVSRDEKCLEQAK